MLFKQDLPTYDTSIFLCTISSECEKGRSPKKEKNLRVQNCFIIHAANSIHIVIDVGASMRQCNAILTVSPNVKVVVY